jgi:hypothetical protein
MMRYLFWGFLAGLFGWQRPVYIRNEVTVDAEGGDSFAACDNDNCDYVADDYTPDDTPYDGGSYDGGSSGSSD